MLTKDEKELLDVLKEQMDDEQKEALSEASEADIKKFLKEARKEIEKEMDKPQTKLRMMYEMRFRDFFEAYGGNKSFVGPFLIWILIKQSKGSWGRLFLCLLVDIAVIAAVVGIVILFK